METTPLYRVCRIITESETGGLPAYQLEGVHHLDFRDHEEAIQWIEDRDAMHKGNEYVILEVFKQE